jgi:hypothetical protein
MLDFQHVLNTPGYDLQTFYGPSTANTTQWQTWRKPRGVKMIYMIGVGGGSSGGTGLNSSTTSGGGAGGGSGGQSSLLIPAAFVPDVLYIQAGNGGQQPATLVSGVVGVAGLPTYVCIEPDSSLLANMTLLFANPGAVTGTAATTTAGGAAGTAAAVATISQMPLAARGQYQLLAGVAGTTGGNGSTPTAGTNVTLPTTGQFVTGGAGGGGSVTTGAAGGNITGVGLGSENFPTLTGGIAASGATPAGAGPGSFIARFFLMNYGGAGGGGATTTAGGSAGTGGNGAPGCGGGGAGGCNTTNVTLARPGDGGPGFVYIISW